MFGSAGGGTHGGEGGGRIWFNITDTIYIDGVVSASGENGSMDAVTYNLGGGGSGGSIWMHCRTIKGYGLILARGGNGAVSQDLQAGGGAGGRIALYFQVNQTLSEFRYLANGGPASWSCDGCESGGPGTVFLYHMIEEHRTLLIDNDGAPNPLTRYVNWENLSEDGGRAWILSTSGLHAFAGISYSFHFEELQIYGNGHFAIMPLPDEMNLLPFSTASSVPISSNDYNVTAFFKYMIGDRTGTVHVGDEQTIELMREEIDLPFNCYVYYGGYLGLAPITFVHGVDIHLGGVLANIHNLTLHHGGYFWMKHGGRTLGQDYNHYDFQFVRIQDDSTLNATTDPVSEPGIWFTTRALKVEGGGIFHGSRMILMAENITVDAGGKIAADALGYQPHHTNATHGHLSLHGYVNSGAPDPVIGTASGGGHGGSGGRGSNSDGHGAGFAYDDLYEPDDFGSSGGVGWHGEQGGTGGGIIWLNVTGFIYIDGEVSANGGHAGDGSTAGGGSAGSVWMYSNVLKGYGKITANGGRGATSGSESGGGGGGGRIAIYFNKNETMSSFRYHTKGGAAGSQMLSENGGAGTAFVYHMMENHKTLIIDNGGLLPRDKHHIINDYANLSTDGCRTWILPESAKHYFANGNGSFHFEELQIYGGAHVAMLTEPVDTKADLFFRYMIGDRTGTFHVGMNQVLDLEREEIDLPFSVRVYDGGYLGLAPFTIVYNVSIWMHGALAHIENITLHHNGLLSLHQKGHTEHELENQYMFDVMRIQDNATVLADTDPVTETGVEFHIIALFVEGGGNLVGTNTTIQAVNVTIDDGGSIHADGLGYRTSHPQDIASGINLGLGMTHFLGSSGGGHGGTSGRGAGGLYTGQPYGHLFQPYVLGSTGGGGSNFAGDGGGLIWMNVTNRLLIDGEIRANGHEAVNETGGGGSGGSIWINCYIMKGTGNITANGGDQYWMGEGGGGAGGRIAVYLHVNSTYFGTYQSHGGYASGTSGDESGGPGTAFLYHEIHQHSTLYINNNMRTSSQVGMVSDHQDLATDSFKAWILPNAGIHWLANGSFAFHFDELQIFGNAHLALLPEPFDNGCSLYFKHMIGDRTGVIHVGPHQVMDLRRSEIDTPFSAYVYQQGYLGLAPDTILKRVFVHIEGTMDHVINLTLVDRGELRLHLSGSTNNRQRLDYHINGTTVIKAGSSINASSPFARVDQYNLVFNQLTVEGGGAIKGKNLRITAIDMTVDDGGLVDVSDGGYLAGLGPGKYYLLRM